MCEINAYNFENKFPEIKKKLQQAKFIGLDLEFSALNPISNCTPSLFDDPKKRYAKLRKNVEFTIPIQIGLTAFHFDADKNHWLGHTYTFYVKPGLFSHINSYFCFENSSLEFLALYNFDFNKFVYSSVPYISRVQEQELRQKLKNDEISETNVNFAMEVETILTSQFKVVNEWYKKAKKEDCLTFPEVSERFRNNLEFKYFFHRHFRRAFKNLWTFEHDNIITFRKVKENELLELQLDNNLDEQLLQNLLGFGKIYSLLTSLKKPIIAHNAFMDVLILINNFEGPLPASYPDFKVLANKLFPVIFDTKHICYNLRKFVPEEKRWDNTDLKSLFTYFKDGTGRHLAMHSPCIDIHTENHDYFNKFHEAGWDSFCAGYIFIRMAFLKIHENQPKSKIFMPVEYINGLEEYKNRVNIIRASINHINLSGDDPETIRPPWLLVETLRKRELDIRELSSTLSAYGNVEVKPFSWSNYKAVVAVDNYGSAKAILRGLSNSSKFRVHQYNFIKHSPIVQAIMWGGVTLSGVTLIWFLHTNMRS